MKKKQFPFVSGILMLIFLIGGSLLMLLPHSTPAIWGMDIPSFIIMYGGDIFLIAACFYHIYTGK